MSENVDTRLNLNVSSTQSVKRESVYKHMSRGVTPGDLYVNEYSAAYREA